MTTPSPAADRFVVCIQNDDYTASLDLRKIYRAVPDPRAEADGLLRVVDESGEDYLYPTGWFRAIEVSEGLAAELRQAS
jgi:hypothetical protein